MTKKTTILSIAIAIVMALSLFMFTACDLFDLGDYPPTSPPVTQPPVVTPPEPGAPHRVLQQTERGTQFEGGLRVTFINVGQGDAAVVEFPEGQRMLIDAGRWNLTHNRFRTDLRTFFPAGETMQFDWVIFTHSHADHIGSGAYVVNNSYIQNIIRPITFTADEIANEVYTYFDIPLGEARYHRSGSTVGASPVTFNNLITAMNSATWHDGTDTNIDIPRAGTYFYIGESAATRARITMHSPTTHNYGGGTGRNKPNINIYSTIFCITFNGRTILFTGDAYVVNEERVLANLPQNIDILDAGHHGSNTSTGQALLDRTTPTYTVIQVGDPVGHVNGNTGNSYGHPHVPVLARLQAANSTVLQTNVHCHIVIDISPNGQNMRIVTANPR